MTKLRWGILGTGNIAQKFAKALPASKTGVLSAVASRTAQKAAAFGKEFGASNCHKGYQALLRDKTVDGVYIALPHELHAAWSVRGAEAGKHILCEKPLALNRWEAEAAVEAARGADVFLAEGFMVQFHPLTQRWLQLLWEGAIGTPLLLEGTFSFVTPGKSGQGSILDLGCYCMAAARHAAGAAEGKKFLDPVEVRGSVVLDPKSGVDVSAAAVVKFETGLLARIACGRLVSHENVLRISGTKGTLTVPAPWIANKEGGPSVVLLQRGKEGKTERFQVNCKMPVFALEADAVAEHLAAGEAPDMPHADSLGNMTALDAWRASAGVVFAGEKAEKAAGPLRGGRLKARHGNVMKYGKIAGLEQPVSRLIMGVDNQNSFPHAAMLFDDFVEHGGNTFDTAHIYGGGHQEKLLGSWIKSRDVRDRLNVIVKGAHTPYCTPVDLVNQFEISLGRLGIECADIYIMHRDNLEVPVGEFVDVLNALKKQGKLRVFGGSNWTLERLEAANKHAKRKGLQGMGLVSNNFSLARMVDPVWSGCIAASEPEFAKWLREKQFPVLAWSSQARGFFTERAHPDKKEDEELVRCWYSKDNFERRSRAIALAKKRGVNPINIALAYVLAQLFPTFALVGPRNLHEWRTTLPGLQVELTPDEVAWLNLER